ncbi:MAG: VanZ family protein [Acidobacteriia bacterium]|nr:VanZ family protein [Terriglobia bacterium]
MTGPRSQPPVPQWSRRILIAAAIGIVFLTLFPFRFSLQTELPANASPFLLGVREKNAGTLDNFLNILLFVPFGFGLAEVIRKWGRSRTAPLALSLVAGAAASYSVEFLQLYIPGRDSGWLDVFTNTAGSVAGAALFELCGSVLLRPLSRIEELLESFLTLQRACWLIVLYLGGWFAISLPLQIQTRLEHWGPDSFLVVGNDASGRPGNAWKGQVLRLQLWDRALPDAQVSALTAGKTPGGVSAEPRAAYTFSGPPPFRDQRQFLPDLSRRTATPAQADSTGLVPDATSWVVSEAPVAAFAAAVQRTNQFAMRIVCAPAGGIGASGRIVSISRPSGIADLSLRQENGNLVFWFRSPLSVKRTSLTWHVADVLATNQVHDILYSYDGSDLSLYVDGKRIPQMYRLGPGAALAALPRRVKPAELYAYSSVYYALVFFPAGVLLGLAARRLTRRDRGAWLVLGTNWLLPPWILECLLVWVSGRPVHLEIVALSLALAAGGALWINADGARKSGSVN